jgi:hypothetical protein
MDSKRAKECILIASEWNGSGQCTYYELKEARKIAAEALEKQIPKKPEIKLNGTTGQNTFCHCPNCKSIIVGNKKYCDNCGQTLDWEG